MPGIFVSYRREDSQGFAGRLADDLIDRFGEDQVFRDDDITPGNDFARVITDSVSSCPAVLTVIGPRWLSAVDDRGRRRLDHPRDWVRIEVETALDRAQLVVPVLVGGARMPRSHQLPPSMARLSRLQAFRISDRRWEYDLSRLAELIDASVPQLRKAPNRTRGGGESQESGLPHETTRSAPDLGALQAMIASLRMGRGQPRMWSLKTLLLMKILSFAKRVLFLGAAAAVTYLVIQRYGAPTTQQFLDDVLRAVVQIPGRLATWLQTGT